MQPINGTFYDILRVLPTATYEEIKISYHLLIIDSHPDKEKSDGTLFLAQQRAWETLRDEFKRREYDLELRRTFPMKESKIMEDIGLDETDGGAFACRCGGMAPFDTSASYPQVVNCDGCSLHYRIVESNAVS